MRAAAGKGQGLGLTWSSPSTQQRGDVQYVKDVPVDQYPRGLQSPPSAGPSSPSAVPSEEKDDGCRSAVSKAA